MDGKNKEFDYRDTFSWRGVTLYDRAGERWRSGCVGTGLPPREKGHNDFIYYLAILSIIKNATDSVTAQSQPSRYGRPSR